MSNQLITALISGNLGLKQGVVFDNTKPHYFIEYHNGIIGCYGKGFKNSFNVYNEYSLNADGNVIQSTNSVRNLFTGGYIDNFYKCIIDVNYNYANVSNEDLNNKTELEPFFIVNVYWYDPKATNKLETLNLKHFAKTTEQKNKLIVNEKYFNKLKLGSKLVNYKNNLVNITKKYLLAMVDKFKQENKQTSNIITINLKSEIISIPNPLSTYLEMLQSLKLDTETNNGTNNDIFSLTDIFTLALVDTNYKLVNENIAIYVAQLANTYEITLDDTKFIKQEIKNNTRSNIKQEQRSNSTRDKVTSESNITNKVNLEAPQSSVDDANIDNKVVSTTDADVASNKGSEA